MYYSNVRVITTEKAIPVTIETYWMLRDKREQMSKNLDKHVTFDEVIRSLIDWDLVVISERRGLKK